MKWFYSLKTSVKLISSFLVVAVILAFVGVYGLSNLETINNSLDDMYTNNLIHKIVSMVNNAGQKISEIAAASEEQAAQSTNALAAVENISATTEQSAASSEETASSAQSLANLAEELQNTVATFRL